MIRHILVPLAAVGWLLGCHAGPSGPPVGILAPLAVASDDPAGEEADPGRMEPALASGKADLGTPTEHGDDGSPVEPAPADDAPEKPAAPAGGPAVCGGAVACLGCGPAEECLVPACVRGDGDCPCEQIVRGDTCGWEAEEEGQTPSCDVFVAAVKGGPFSCEAYCQTLGSLCLAAWDDTDDTCQLAAPEDCGAARGDQICRCTR